MSVALAAYAPFADEVSKGTGLNFDTVLGWVNAEGGPQTNPLNIGPGKKYADEHAAALATIANITRPGASSNPYHELLTVARNTYKTTDAEIAAEAHAIAYSPWKGNDGLPRAKYEQNITAGALVAIYEEIKPGTTYAPANPNDPTGPGFQTNPAPADPVSGLLSGIAAPFVAIGNAASSIAELAGRLYGWLVNPDSWKRIGFGLAGVVLVIGGLLVVVRG